MPVVPFSGTRQSAAPSTPPPDEPWALMAAAQMHAEGRLIESLQPTEADRGKRTDDRR